MNIIKSGIQIFSANIVNAVIKFFGIAYFARELGASVLGVFFLFEAMLGMLSLIANFGLRGALEKRISEGTDQSVYLTSTILLKILPLVVMSLAIFLFQSTINEYLGSPLALYLIISIILQEISKLSIFVLKGELRVGETASLKLAKEISWVATGIFLINIGYGVEGLVLGLLTGFVVVSCWGWWKVSITLSSPSIKHSRSLFNYGKFNLVSNISGYFYSWVDVAIIGLFLTQAHVGAYEVAWRLTAFVVLLGKSISTAIFPQMSQWDAEGSREQIESVIRDSMGLSLLVVIPAFFVALLYSREILGYMFGFEYTIASLALIILMGEKIVQSIHLIIGRGIQAIDRPDLAAKASAVSIVLNVFLNLILIQYFDIAGAALATATSFTLNSILHGFYLSKYLSIQIPYSLLLSAVLSSISMTVILLLIESLYPISNLLGLLVAIIVGAITYGTISVAFPATRAMIKKFARRTGLHLPT